MAIVVPLLYSIFFKTFSFAAYQCYTCLYKLKAVQKNVIEKSGIICSLTTMAITVKDNDPAVTLINYHQNLNNTEDVSLFLELLHIWSNIR